jgi:hypothetical protein
MQNINYTVGNFVHAYKQAPWRIQLQWVGAFLLGMCGLALVAALYLDITSQAALAGRGIQDMTAQLTVIQHTNADLESKLAEVSSTSVMEQRAVAMGYVPVDPSQVEYIIVPGYVAAKPAILSSMPVLKPVSPSQPSEYTQSLLDWLDQHLRASPTAGLIGVIQ